jgi:phosphoribosyl 1,2-cyclic phosphate phosphodiesterase
MKITILGCGTSSGVPSIGNNWGACDPSESKNHRLRVSILVEEGDTTLLVDTSPDMRQQLLNCNLQKLDGVLYTHAHADHCHGIDDLRSINWLTQKPVAIYADAITMEELRTKFSYIFEGNKTIAEFYRPGIVPHIIDGKFTIKDIEVTPFLQRHAPNLMSLGFRFGDFAYSTDAHKLDDVAFEALRGIKVWVVDCVREKPHPTHSHLEQTLEWIARVKPERAFLTHMNNSMDYATLRAKLPDAVEPAYDGLVITC